MIVWRERRCQLRGEMSGCGWGLMICLRDNGHVPPKIALNGQTSTGDDRSVRIRRAKLHKWLFKL